MLSERHSGSKVLLPHPKSKIHLTMSDSHLTLVLTTLPLPCLKLQMTSTLLPWPQPSFTEVKDGQGAPSPTSLPGQGPPQTAHYHLCVVCV